MLRGIAEAVKLFKEMASKIERASVSFISSTKILTNSPTFGRNTDM